jgi:hypothetical protein
VNRLEARKTLSFLANYAKLYRDETVIWLMTKRNRPATIAGGGDFALMAVAAVWPELKAIEK